LGRSLKTGDDVDLKRRVSRDVVVEVVILLAAPVGGRLLTMTRPSCNRNTSHQSTSQEHLAGAMIIASSLPRPAN